MKRRNDPDTTRFWGSHWFLMKIGSTPMRRAAVMSFAYMTFLCSHLFQTYLPGLFGIYFFVAMMVAFLVSGALGLATEWLLIRHLYARPLDTLLATWGLSLIMQQAFRSIFGAREVGVELPKWMMGSLPVTGSIEVQINGLFVMGLTIIITAVVALLLYKSRWGLQVRAVV